MTTAVEVQALLRFLTQDAKLPLSLAMGKIKEMQGVSMTRLLSPSSIPSNHNSVYVTYSS